MSQSTLTWLLTKDTSSFLVKRGGSEFAKEKYNLLNRNCPKYSGFASNNAVDMSLKNKEITLSLKDPKLSHKPTEVDQKFVLSKGRAAGKKVIQSKVCHSYYRRDLKAAALTRWSRLCHVSQVEKGLRKPMKVKSHRVAA